MRRSRQRRWRAALPWVLAVGLAALVGVTAWIVVGTSVLGVRQVRVAGVEILTAAQVRDAAAVPAGHPMAALDTSAISDRVSALPPVERVRVFRKWPGTVVIEVVERTGVAAVPQDGRFAVVDASGVVFRSLTQRPADLPLVRVAAPGRDDPATRGALSVVAALTPQLRERLVEVTVAGPAQITLRLAGNRTVIWGDPSQNDVKARVATALLDRDAATIDVSAPEVVTVR
jgi:cell division protein FtsQ